MANYANEYFETNREQFDRLNSSGYPCSYWGEFEQWLIITGRHRDSDVLTNCNWDCIVKQFDELENKLCDDLSDYDDRYPDGIYQIESANHWAVGWVENLVINPDCDKAIELAVDIARALENYPVLDDEAFSNAEYEDYLENWDNWAESDTRKIIESSLPDDLAFYLDCVDMSEFYSEASQHVNWLYSGESINCEGIAEYVVSNHLADIRGKCAIVETWRELFYSNRFSPLTDTEQSVLNGGN